MVVRLATETDADACAAIYGPAVEGSSASFEEVAPDAGEMARRIAQTGPRFPWVVEEAVGRVRGYAYAGPHRARPAYRWAADVAVYVDAGARGEGVGRAVLGAVVRILTLQGYRAACGGIAQPNPASVRLHESLGFALVGVYPRIGWKLGAWRDVGWWVAPLGEDAGDGPPAEPVPMAALAGGAAVARILAEAGTPPHAAA
jgi:L-amino acid N-acyltransferase YncA